MQKLKTVLLNRKQTSSKTDKQTNIQISKGNLIGTSWYFEINSPSLCRLQRSAAIAEQDSVRAKQLQSRKCEAGIYFTLGKICLAGLQEQWNCTIVLVLFANRGLAGTPLPLHQQGCCPQRPHPALGRYAVREQNATMPVTLLISLQRRFAQQSFQYSCQCPAEAVSSHYKKQKFPGERLLQREM